MNTVAQQDTIDCPYCAETIKRSAKKCIHCGEIVDAQMRDIEALKKERNSSNVYMNAGGGASTGSGNSDLKPFNHWLHAVLSLFTGGLWIPVYLVLYLMRNKNVYH